jgi:predicted acyltransferase
MSDPSSPKRIVSMDQFRGYTVAGMFVVNFLASFGAIHALFKHNNTYFSFADSIMPSFMFAVGFSFRLTYLRRVVQAGYWPTVRSYVRRSIALVVVSLVMYGFGSTFQHWADFSTMPAEFEPFRPKAPRTRSFDELVVKARKANPKGDERTILSQASQMGAAILEPGSEQPQEGSSAWRARQAAEIVDQEEADFVGAAVRRMQNWRALTPGQQMLVHLRIAVGKLLKQDLWETLAIIGATQLVVLAFINRGFWARFAVLIALGGAHLALSYWFNWDFVYGINDNWMSQAWMTGSGRSWDGGFFGPLCWAVAMLAGTLAYDLVQTAASNWNAAARLIVWGAAFMAVGYGMSCLSRVYDVPGDQLEARRLQWMRYEAERNWLGQLEKLQKDRLDKLNERRARLKERRERLNQPAPPQYDPEIDLVVANLQALSDQKNAYPVLELADNPVIPSWDQIVSKSWRELLVEPPFVAPPRDNPAVDPQPGIEHRLQNYWMLGKRMPNLSFITFASGFAFALYGVFVIVCDIGGLTIGLFRTFGTNALAAYFLHHVVHESVKPLVPDDSHLWYCLGGFALFFLLTYACVRFLEQHKIYVKL